MQGEHFANQDTLKASLMEQSVSTTKEALLFAAGELFAEHGVEGTSIRAIAEKCQANIAAVNYHFGTKENLYHVLIRRVLEKTRCRRAEALMKRKQDWAHDPLKCAEALYGIVEEHIHQYFTGTHPRWYGRLFMRILLQPTPAIGEIMSELVMRDFDSLKEVLRCCRPGMSREESELWADSLIGQLTHYIFAEDFLLMVPGRRSYDEAFQRDILHHVSRVLIRGLELPMPAFLMERKSNA
ncbi:MAG TPA: TetR/AcrR family transcriptional regulator [Candidatus Hydrogenedentes bacterium]|nr:TetR/AcrR family transcriptional regulator [Candidatus Hydrogenedentota bacterium]